MRIFITVSLLCWSITLIADDQRFKSGAIIKEYGKIAVLDEPIKLPENTVFRVAFDRMKAASDGELNSGLVMLARYINMHHDSGVPLANIQGAMVVHSAAIMDVTKDSFYQNRKLTNNANTELVKQLLANGVRILVCGQSASWQNISREDLLPGVEMSLSAITAHALLQQQGYTLNPF